MYTREKLVHERATGYPPVVHACSFSRAPTAGRLLDEVAALDAGLPGAVPERALSALSSSGSVERLVGGGRDTPALWS